MCSMTKSIQTFVKTYDEACGELLITDSLHNPVRGAKRVGERSEGGVVWTALRAVVVEYV